MLSRRLAICIATITFLAVASAAPGAAPIPSTSGTLPRPAKAYTTHGPAQGLEITLVTGAHDPRRIEPGEAAIGTPYSVSGGWVACPGARPAADFRGTPFALFGFPGATLRAADLSYGFTKTFERRHATVFGSDAKPFHLRLRVKATVVSSTRIEGSLEVRGGPCTRMSPLHFTATPDDRLPAGRQS